MTDLFLVIVVIELLVIIVQHSRIGKRLSVTWDRRQYVRKRKANG